MKVFQQRGVNIVKLNWITELYKYFNNAWTTTSVNCIAKPFYYREANREANRG